MIIPILDPVDQDRIDFILWMLKPAGEVGKNLVDWMDKTALPPDFFGRWYAALRSQIKAIPPKTEEELKAIIGDFINPQSVKRVVTKRYRLW